MSRVTRGTARLQTTDAARRYQTASVRNATDPAPSRDGRRRALLGTRGSGADARAGRALDARRLVASPTRPACARTATARGSGHAASSRHWHSTRRSSRRSAGCPPRHRKRAARCRLLYWESGVAMATPVEVVDDAVLSGRTRTTNNHAIAATHQAADSNAALPRRERGAANAEASRGDASRPLRAATAASTTSRCSQRQESSFSNRSSLRALVACACCSVSKALGQPFRAFVCAADVGHRPNHQLWRFWFVFV